MRIVRGCLILFGFALFGLATSARGAGQPAAPRADLYGDPLPEGALARLGSVRFHHPGGLIAAAFSPDGKTMMAVGAEEDSLSVRFWDMADGKERSRFNAKGRELTGAMFTPDGKNVLVGRGSTPELYEIATGKLLRSFECNNAFTAMWTNCALSPDGKLLVQQGHEWQEDSPFLVWDIAKGRELAPFVGRGAQAKLVFSADGKRLISCSIVPHIHSGGGMGFDEKCPHVVCVWDVATRKKLHEIVVGKGHVAIAPPGDVIAYDDPPDGWVHVIPVADGAERCKFAAPGSSFAFSPDGTAIVVLRPTEPPYLLDAATGQKLRSFKGHVGAGSRLVGFSPDGKRLALMDGGWASDGMIRLFDVATGEQIRHTGGHEDEIACLAFSPGGQLLASGSHDNTVRLWEPSTGKELAKLEGHNSPISALAFAPDSKVLASSSADGVTRLWEIATGRQLLQLDGPEGGAVSLTFTGDGKSLIAGGNGAALHVWDTTTGKTIRGFKTGVDGAVVALSADAKVALSANGEARDDLSPERLRLWSTTTCKGILDIPLREFQFPPTNIVCHTAVFSADARMLASSQLLIVSGLRTSHHSPMLRLWERSTGQEILSIDNTTSRAMTFSPDGRLLAAGTGAWQGTSIDLWNPLTGQRVRTLKGHASLVRSVAFSPDGKTLASGSNDHTILVWENASAPAAQQARQHASTRQLQRWWTDLGGPAPAAYQALSKLLTHRTQTVEWIRARLKPAPAVDGQRIAALVQDLDSAQYLQRQQATVTLEGMGELAESALRQALQGNPTLERKRRLELLLAKVENAVPSPEQLTALRAVAALEWIDSLESRQLLASLADGRRRHV